MPKTMLCHHFVPLFRHVEYNLHADCTKPCYNFVRFHFKRSQIRLTKYIRKGFKKKHKLSDLTEIIGGRSHAGIPFSIGLYPQNVATVESIKSSYHVAPRKKDGLINNEHQLAEIRGVSIIKCRQL
jgi:hypothetical protein